MVQLIHLLALAGTTLALSFTSPATGSTVDLTSPLVITWTSSSSDPSSINIAIVNTVQGSSAAPQTLGSNIATSSGELTIPANTISNYGDGFTLVATSASSGAQIASSGDFSLADGVYSVETASNGALTIATSTTATEAVPTAPQTVASAAATTTIQAPAATTGSVEASSGSSSSPTTTSSNSGSGSSSSSQTSSSSTSTSTGSNGNLGFGSNSAAGLQRGNRLLASIFGASALVLGALIVLV